MKKLIVFLVGLWVSSVVHAALITGSVSLETEGIETNPLWGTVATILTFEVENTGGGVWSYRYTFRVPVGSSDEMVPSVNRLVIQTGEPFTATNVLTILSPYVWEVDRWDMGHTVLYGIMFSDLMCTMCEIAFTSDMVPIWGGFAADGILEGATGIAYNTFTGNFSTASIFGLAPDGFILVPRAVPDPSEVREPMTLLLVMGAALFFFRRCA